MPKAKPKKIEKINLAHKLTLFHDHWNPRIVAELNESYVKLVKVKGEFVWHHHENEDELFLVLEGKLTIGLRDGEITLGMGEIAVIPRGVEHKPAAREEAHLLLLEPKTTLNTGNARSALTSKDEFI